LLLRVGVAVNVMAKRYGPRRCALEGNGGCFLGISASFHQKESGTEPGMLHFTEVTLFL
jgi:hypothetical protein